MSSSYCSAFLQMFQRISVLGIFCLAGTFPLHAQQENPGWQRTEVPTGGVSVAPSSSAMIYGKLSLPSFGFSNSSSGGGAFSLLTTPNVAPEVQEVADALGHDPLAIFNWVRNRIDYQHYRGVKKGALVTMVEKGGNDYDQSLLLRDLLLAAGFTPSLKHGFTAIPYSDFAGADVQHWLGLPQASYFNNIADSHLILRGTQFDEAEKDFFNLGVKRVWVEVEVGGATYQLDPSFKKYEEVPGLDLVTASGYQRASALAQLAGTVGDSGLSVEDAAETAFGTYLRDRTTTLLQTLAQPANAFLKPLEVSGGWRLIPWHATSLSGGFPLISYGTVDTWTDVPADRFATITLRLGTDPANNQVSLTVTKTLAELAGKRLTLEFAKSGANTKAQFWLDDTLLGEEPSFVAGATTRLEIKIDHPTNTGAGDQTFTQTYKRTVTANGMPNGTAIYALSYGFEVSQESLRRRERVLEDYRAAGKANNSREIMGETLNVIGQHWYLQTELIARLIANLTDCANNNFHRIGRVAQEEGVYIDVMGQYSGTLSRTLSAADSDAAFTTASFFWSAMEHGVLDQLQGLTAASTVGLISRANTLSHKIFVVHNATEFSAIQGQLTGYSAAQITELQGRLAQGATLVLPLNGDLRMAPTDAWHGTGYVSSSSSEIGMIISGGYNGGYSTNTYYTQPTIVFNTTRTGDLYVTVQPPNVRLDLSWDPVDLATGFFLLSPAPDMTVGETLAFTRNYHGSRRTDDGCGIGYGWTHSGNLLLSERTNVENGLGLRSAPDMAATLVSAVAVLDLYRNRGADAKPWIGSLLASQWGVTQLKNNSVSVQMPDRNMEFTRQPDASFTPPPGITVALAKNTGNNTYAVTPRHGGVTTFEAIPSSTGNYRIKQSTDLWNRTTAYTYDGTSKRLTRITDPFGRYINLAYTNNRVSTVTDSTGRSLSYTYDTGGNLTRYTDPEGKWDDYVYDTQHRITETKDHSGRTVVKNFYDSRHRVVSQQNQGLVDRVYEYRYAPGITRETDPAGGVMQHLFDDRSRSIGKINPLGQRHVIGYDGRDHEVLKVTALGRTSTAVYDAYDNLVSTTDPTGAITTYGYDPQHRLTSHTDPLNRVTTFTYNATHQVTTATNAVLETTTNAYNATTGFLTTVTNHVGHVTSFEYDAYGQLKKTTLPDTTVLNQSVTVRGDLEWTDDARGIRTTFTYNNRREPLTSTTGGRQETTEYNDNRMAWRVTNARGFAVSQTFSPTGKLLTSRGPDGATESNGYDVRDNPASTSGPMGETIQMTYDLANRPETVTDPLNRVLTTVYDGDGMVGATLAPLGRNRSTTYQIAPGLPRLVTQTDPLNHSITTEHDAAGQKRFITNRNNQIFEIGYDNLGRVTQTVQPGGRTTTVTHSLNVTGGQKTHTEPSGQSTTAQFDKRGRLVSRTGTDFATTFSYDASGNLLTTQEGATTLTRTYEPTRDLVKTYTNAEGETLAYTYDNNGNLATLRYPDGKTVTYAYDSNDRMIAVTDWSGRITSLEYDLSGRLLGIRRPNGTARRTAYDATGQLLSLAEVHQNGSTIAYQGWKYDAAGRPLQRMKVPGTAAFTTPGYVATYRADNRMETLTPDGGAVANVSDDLDGNLLLVPLWEPQRTWNPTTFNWDARNRLMSTNTSAGIAVSYRYDAEGYLVRRTTNGESTRYTVNPNAALSQVLVAHHSSGSKTYYVYGPGLLYEENFSASGASEGARSYHYDQVGSTIALTDDTGAVTGRADYTAYGVTASLTGNVDTPFRYNGQFGVMTDVGTGLLHMRARWYSPSLGRFLNEDPIGFEGGMNWYAYCEGDPIVHFDASGTSMEEILVGIQASEMQKNLPDPYPSRPLTEAERAHTQMLISALKKEGTWAAEANQLQNRLDSGQIYVAPWMAGTTIGAVTSRGYPPTIGLNPSVISSTATTIGEKAATAGLLVHENLHAVRVEAGFWSNAWWNVTAGIIPRGWDPGGSLRTFKEHSNYILQDKVEQNMTSYFFRNNPTRPKKTPTPSIQSLPGTTAVAYPNSYSDGKK